MGQKTKGGRWCDTCQRPVMGVKNTHRVRNTLSVGGSLATGGVSLLEDVPSPVELGWRPN